MRPVPGGPRFRPDVLVLAVLASVAVALFAQVRLPPDVARGQTSAPPAVADDPPRHVQDFAYVVNYARRALERPGVSPYGYEEHRAFLRAWLGPRVRSALCFAYGPALVVVLAPLFPLTAAWAWLVWNLAGAWLTASSATALARGDRGALAWSRLSVLGFTAFHTLVNGQTALVTTGCFGALMHLDRALANPRARTLACAACVVALSAKPPLALVALVALLLAGRRSAVAAAAVGIGTIVALAMAWWTPSIVWDYADLVRRYNLVDADEVVRAGFVPEAMSNLRAVLLRAGLDDGRAFRASGGAFALALGMPLVARLVRRTPWPLHVAAGWTVMAYLLFAPHLSPTEDLLALVPLATFLAANELRGWQRAALVAGCVGPQWINGSAALVLGASSQGWGSAAPLAAFALKLLPAAVVAARSPLGATPRGRD